jgi:aspartate aminotransferase
MINVLASETFSAVSAPIQYAAIKAYENDHQIILINQEIF